MTVEASQESGQHKVLLHHHDEGPLPSCSHFGLAYHPSHLCTSRTSSLHQSKVAHQSSDSADRQAGRQAGRQTDRQAETDRDRHTRADTDRDRHTRADTHRYRHTDTTRDIDTQVSNQQIKMLCITSELNFTAGIRQTQLCISHFIGWQPKHALPYLRWHCMYWQDCPVYTTNKDQHTLPTHAIIIDVQVM